MCNVLYTVGLISSVQTSLALAGCPVCVEAAYPSLHGSLHVGGCLDLALLCLLAVRSLTALHGSVICVETAWYV